MTCCASSSPTQFPVAYNHVSEEMPRTGSVRTQQWPTLEYCFHYGRTSQWRWSTYAGCDVETRGWEDQQRCIQENHPHIEDYLQWDLHHPNCTSQMQCGEDTLPSSGEPHHRRGQKKGGKGEDQNWFEIMWIPNLGTPWRTTKRQESQALSTERTQGWAAAKIQDTSSSSSHMHRAWQNGFNKCFRNMTLPYTQSLGIHLGKHW